MKIYSNDEYDDDIDGYGYKKFDENRMVTLYCENKKIIVSGVLDNDISTTISNQWSDFFQNGLVGGITSAIDTISTAKNAWNGTSLHQPFMSRKMWSGTNPLSFDLDMTFIAVTDAKLQVFDPITKLCAMAVAHKGNDTKTANMLKESVDSILKTGKTSSGQDAKKYQEILAKSVDTLDDMIKSMSQSWVSPGPVVIPTTDTSNTSQQDAPVTLQLPSFGGMVFKNCYIENISITFSKTVDSKGYPLVGKAKIHISRMDAPISKPSSDGQYTMEWNYQYDNEGLNKLSSGINKLYDVLNYLLVGTQERILSMALGGEY